MTGTPPRWPTRSICVCGETYERHDIERKAAPRIGGDGASIVCPAFTVALVEECPPPSELQRRLDLLAGEHQGYHWCGNGTDVTAVCYEDGQACPVALAVRGDR
jgi:hypothetical protein